MACKSCGKSRTNVSRPRTPSPIQQRTIKSVPRVSVPRSK